MRGIVGYLGSRDGQQIVIGGLRQSEYRGCNSVGVVVVTGGELYIRKRAGKIANLATAIEADPLSESGTAIGHTRQVTHGMPTGANSYPHIAGRIAIVRNDIIESHAALGGELDVEFISETGSEVAAHLLFREITAGADLVSAMRVIVTRLEGAFMLAAVDTADPDRIIAARCSSPSVMGIGDDGYFLVSDVAAFIEHTHDAVESGQDQIVELVRDGVAAMNFDGTPTDTRGFHVDWDLGIAQKQGYGQFTRKEISEQPHAVADALLRRTNELGEVTLNEIRTSPEEPEDINKIVVMTRGTVFYVGLVARYAIKHWTRISCEVESISELRYRDPIVDSMTPVMTISQSGETAGILMAVRYAREQYVKVVAVCNTSSATISHRSDVIICTHAGPGVGVVSTEGLTTQLTVRYLLGLYLAQIRETKYANEVGGVLEELGRIPEELQKLPDVQESVLSLTARLKDELSILFLGRHVGYPAALEDVLELKELAYIHAEGFATGELKYDPVALISEGLSMFMVVPPHSRDQLRDKVISDIAEVRTRGVCTIMLVEANDADARAHADHSIKLSYASILLQPLPAITSLQLFAREVVTLRGHDIDQPYNLAKSVTVE